MQEDHRPRGPIPLNFLRMEEALLDVRTPVPPLGRPNREKVGSQEGYNQVGTLADPAVGIPGARTNRNDTGQGRAEELPPPMKRLRRTAEANEKASGEARPSSP